MNKLFIIFPLLLCSGTVRAQDTTTALPRPSSHSIALMLGINNFHVRDEYASPLIYRGTVFTASASYRVVHESDRQTIEAEFGTGTLTSSPRQFDAQHYLGSLSYLLLFKVHTVEAGRFPVALFTGGGASTTFWAGEYRSNTALQPNSFGDGYAVHGLNIALGARARIGETGSVMLHLTSPVIRLVSRPEYTIVSDRENGYVYSATHPYVEYFWESTILLFQADYEQTLNDTFDVQATYKFGFNACDVPLPLSAYSNKLVVGIQWKL